jgi:integrase
MELPVSAIQIPGLDIEERSPGAFRARVRVNPFFALTNTFGNELASLSWGCQQLERLHALHKQLSDEARLPSALLSREAAQALGLAELIAGEAESQTVSPAKLSSPGADIFVFDVLDSYMANEGKELSPGYAGRAKRLKKYFGNVALSTITTASLKTYVDARLSGELGYGRSKTASYASNNRENQRNLRRRHLGIPVVVTPRTCELPCTGSVRHELKLFRQALKAYATRDDARRERIGGYVVTHPILCIELPAPGDPRKRRISDQELTSILARMSCPKKRAAIMLCIYTSIRRAEVVSLKIEDINWADSTVTLRAPMQLDPNRPGQMRKKRKTKTVEREVPLVPQAVELLRRVCERTKGPIFDFKASSLTQAFGRAAEDAGVLNVRVHDTRREALSWLHDVHGLTLEQLTMFSGHTEIKTLQKHYFQPSASKMAALVGKHVGAQRNIIN